MIGVFYSGNGHFHQTADVQIPTVDGYRYIIAGVAGVGAVRLLLLHQYLCFFAYKSVKIDFSQLVRLCNQFFCPAFLLLRGTLSPRLEAAVPSR